MLGKTSRAALAVVAFLAENYKGKVVFSKDIIEKIGLSASIVTRVLSILSRLAIVQGSPGPKGGYCLLKAPEDIYLKDIVNMFERFEVKESCPFEAGHCADGKVCALHDPYVKALAPMKEFLKNTNFKVFENSRL